MGRWISGRISGIPHRFFFAGGMTSQREKAWDRDSLVTSNTLANLQLLVIINNILTCIFCLHLKSKLAAMHLG